MGRGRKWRGHSGDGEECQGREGGADEELYVTVCAVGARGEGEGVHGGGDDHDQHGEDAEVDEVEGPGGRAGPAEARVVGPEEALGEDEVEEEEE